MTPPFGEPIPGPPDTRFALRGPGPAPSKIRCIDGGWWPHSDVIELELEGLVAAAAHAGFHISRVTYRPQEWTPAPEHIVIGNQAIALVALRGQPIDTITLVNDATPERLQLVVVPPDASEEVAARALWVSARDRGGIDPAEEILARAYSAATHAG